MDEASFGLTPEEILVMARSFPHVRRHLSANRYFATLVQELEQQAQLLQQVRGALPGDLALHCLQARLADGALILFVDSPVWADRLRYSSDDLLHRLGAQDPPVQQIKVRVSPVHTNNRTQTFALEDAGSVVAHQENSSASNLLHGELGTELDRALKRLEQRVLNRSAR
jgi:hypothetical protein